MALPLVRTGASAGTRRTNDRATKSTGEDFTKQRTNKEGNQMTQHRLTSNHVEKIEKLASDLMCAFDWASSPEGTGFWNDIQRKLWERAKHGTTDGKPWVEPELTDEDAKQRPWVMVRDRETSNWIGPKTLVAKSGYHYVLNGETSPNKELQGVSAWRFARLATPEEIEAANADR